MALIADRNPFEPIGKMTIEESLEKAFSLYDCSSCQRCGFDREEKHGHLLETLQTIREDFFRTAPKTLLEGVLPGSPKPPLIRLLKIRVMMNQ